MASEDTEGIGPRVLVLQRQMERICRPLAFLFGPVGLVAFSLVWVSGVLSGLFTFAGCCVMFMIGFAPTIALRWKGQMDTVACATLCLLCSFCALAVAEPTAPENASKMPVHHGASFFFCVAAGSIFHLSHHAFLVYLANLLLGFLLMRLRFVSRYGSPDDHSDTVAIAVLGAGVLAALRHSKNVTFETAIEYMRMHQDAEGQRTSFLSYIMHEVRNPLSAACLLICEQGELLEEMKAIVEKSQDGAAVLGRVRCLAVSLQSLTDTTQSAMSQMTVVCNDVPHLEKLASGRFEFEFTASSITKFFNTIAREQVSVMQTKGLKFETGVFVDPSIEQNEKENPVLVWADFQRLRQVVDNLLSNARKFTPKNGKVELRLKVSLLHPSPKYAPGSCLHASQLPDFVFASPGSETSPSLSSSSPRVQWVRVRIEVRDSGVGLEKDELGKLFRPFSQIRAGQQQNGGGTGLGLCISRTLAEAHCGGKVGVESEGRGTGSEFWLEFASPLGEESAADVEAKGEKGSDEAVETEGEAVENSNSQEKEIGENEDEGGVVVNDRKEAEEGRDKEEPGDGGSGSTCLSGASPVSPSRGEGLSKSSIYSSPFGDIRPVSSNNKTTPTQSSMWTRKKPLPTEPFRESSRLPTEPFRESPRLPTEPFRESSRLPTEPFRESSRLPTEPFRESSRLRSRSSRRPHSTPSFLSASKAVRVLQSLKLPSSSSTSTVSSLESLSRLLHGARRMSVGTPMLSGAPAKRLTPPQRTFTADVLIVDDNAMCQLAVSLALRRMGLSVEVAEDGAAAVSRFADKAERYRLVLMDRNMPNLEGPEAIKAITAHLQKEAVHKTAQQMREGGEETTEAEGQGTRKGGGNGDISTPVDGESDCLKEVDESTPPQDHPRDPTSQTDGALPSPVYPAVSLPIFLGLTGQTHDTDAFRQAGALDVILKPVTPRTLQSVFEKIKFKPRSVASN
uniref:histidine kinase n=1 Tax=Chromera velia CCMP2878 TaxID=1169474 RepID=A0A0G4FBT9_9ALVE|eukprot:Cvel_16263.t1-p1 / transcript=Cvel_16263.t1 / gene=Cvel_16263 / organism=Chromera_velia_CCMP2878 / gene_product=Aerobic respiration control sensor protein ArcB, putative / transcript_product=Aerobic respiration control sensor protein ArcB, putative / location=Cvel_scaffold1245:7013-10843(-) / protein_length=961 / sequence_SO=supercontig / SO=protein_coding / is_pseudo=false